MERQFSNIFQTLPEICQLEHWSANIGQENLSFSVGPYVVVTLPDAQTCPTSGPLEYTKHLFPRSLTLRGQAWLELVTLGGSSYSLYDCTVAPLSGKMWNYEIIH